MFKKIVFTQEQIAEFFATFFYLGYCPVMPGTVASFVVACIYFFLPSVSLFFLSMIIAILFFVGVWFSSMLITTRGVSDPSWIVIDEVVGMLITLSVVPKQSWLYGAAFLLFRFFDIVKPFPITLIEQKIPGGWGVMMDDMCAGFCVVGCILFFF